MSKHHVFREYYEAILVAVIFTLFARTFVAQAFKIPTGSMEDNLLVGDHLFVNKFVYAPHWDTPLHRILPYRDIRRGDIVVFKYPQDPERDFIKRAIALGGDTVEVRGKGLSVNGEAEVNPHVVHKDRQIIPDTPALPASIRNRDYFGPFVVPAEFVFCMGDNRDNSYDSRFWGPVPRSYFKGRALFIYWSYEAQPNSHEWRGWWDRMRQLASVGVHFFSRTRWQRSFSVVH
ncbi:MAG: signal peptidase I [Acidobacteria bacterium RBG_13_68_16]|jgi:signal peptidase I|nr:MAG: signal peptidase I [Acidobacteria bacterium RBG_13_68_16]